MKKLNYILLITILMYGFFTSKLYSQKVSKARLIVDASLGAKTPIGITKDDITTGLSINVGLGYKLSKYFELLHLAIDFGNSSPHNPNMLIVQDYYDYNGRVVMETVNIYGFPLSTRFHFPVKQYIDGFIGAGGAYYWFSSKLEDVYYGNLRDPRKRHGFGPFFEAGVYTNFFSEKWLVLLKGDFSYLKTKGKSLSITEDQDPGTEFNRNDKYLTISLGIHYIFD